MSIPEMDLLMQNPPVGQILRFINLPRERRHTLKFVGTPGASISLEAAIALFAGSPDLVDPARPSYILYTYPNNLPLPERLIAEISRAQMEVSDDDDFELRKEHWALSRRSNFPIIALIYGDDITEEETNKQKGISVHAIPGYSPLSALNHLKAFILR